MREQLYQPSHEHAIRSMLLRSQRSPGGLYLPGRPVLARRREPSIIPGYWLAPAHVQTVFNSGSSNTWSVTLTATGGNLLRVLVRAQDEPFNNTTPISSSPANTWVVDVEFERAEGSIQTLNAYALNCASGSTTISGTTQSGGGTDWEVLVAEYSGVATSNAFDKGDSQTDSDSSDVKTTGVADTTTQADAIAIGTFCDLSGGPYSWTQGSGYTLTDGSTHKIAIEHQVLSAIGDYEATITCGATFRSVDCCIAIFKAAGGAAAVKRDNLLLMGMGR